MFSYTSSAWFVEEHYAPFPVSFDEALGRLRAGLDHETTVRLSPVFFRTRAFELRHEDFHERSFGAAFSSRSAPPAEGVLADAKRGLARRLQELSAFTYV